MPILGTTTPLEFAISEWTLLRRAWSGLNPDEKARRANQIIEQKRAAGQLPNFPALPGWDDIVKLGPLQARLTLKDEQERRKRTAIRILQSPTPPELRALGALINAIDDLEDLVTFTSLIGRVVLRFGPRALGRAAPALGVLVTVSDVLNVLTTLVVGASVAAGVSVAGPTAAPLGVAPGAGLKAGLSFAQATASAVNVAGVMGAKAFLKHELWELLRIGTRKGVRVQRLGPVLQRLLRRGEVLESLQATDTLWGVGISLGAIVGFIQDLGWGIHKAAFGPLPRDRVRFTNEIAQNLDPEFVLLERRPLGNLPCYTATGVTPNITKWPGEAYWFLTERRQFNVPALAEGFPVC